MSLEERLAAHTAALEANTAAVLAFTQTFNGALAARGSASPAAIEAANGKANGKSEEKKADAPAEPAKAAAEPAKAEGAKRGRKPKAEEPKAFTIDDLRAKAAEYLNVKDEAVKAKRKAAALPILEHFGVAKFTEIPAENYAEAIGYFDVLLAGGTPNFQNEDAANDENDGDGDDDLI